MSAMTVTIDELVLADDAERWAGLGFELDGDRTSVGAVRIRFAGSDATDGRSPGGLIGWSLRGISTTDLDGLPTTVSDSEPPQPRAAHANGVSSIDHVVAFSPRLDRTVAALQTAGLDLRRVREEPTPAGAPRQAFFRLGGEILEVIQLPDERLEQAGGADAPARLWGLAFVAEDIDATVAALAPHVRDAHDAVQDGRRIATVRRSAGLAVPVAFMTPR
jgi:Glyoxalase-like domain